MSILSFCLFALATASSVAFAKPYACITSDLASLEQNEDEPIIELAALQCKTLHVTDKTLEAISITSESASLYFACTGAIPVSVTLQGVSLGLQALKLIVGELPCDDIKNTKKIEAQMHQVVCDELNSQGISCRL